MKPYIQEDAAVKARALEPIRASTEELQVNNWILESVARLELPDIVAVTRSGHVLRGRVAEFAKDLICMIIRGAGEYGHVIVFKQGLYQLKTTDRFEIQVDNFIQAPQNEADGIIEFSRIALIGSRHWDHFVELSEPPARIYVHISEVPNEDSRLLQPNEKIAFNIAQTEKGLCARNITLLGPKVEEMPLRPRQRSRASR